MAERTKAPVSKTGIRATVSWVRIPLSPPLNPNKASYKTPLTAPALATFSYEAAPLTFPAVSATVPLSAG